MGDRRCVAAGNVPAAQGAGHPPPADGLSQVSGGAAGECRHRRRDRPTSRSPAPYPLSDPNPAPTSSVERTALSDASRSAEIVRKTRETDILLSLDLDGQGRSDVKTGIGFL